MTDEELAKFVPKGRRLVKGEGSKRAKILLVGEAPGKNENTLGRPFVGASGSLLAKWWFEAGLKRKDFRIENLFPYWPDAGDKKINEVMKQGIEWKEGRKKPIKVVSDYCAERLKEKIEELTELDTIVPTGNWALKALLGLNSITKWRGSVLKYKTKDGRTIKVIPTIHPAATMRHPQFVNVCIADWKKIAGQVGEKPTVPQRTTHIASRRTVQRDFDLLMERLSDGRPVAVDLETNPAEGEILCCGFGVSKDECFVFPTIKDHWGSASRLEDAWSKIEAVLQTSNPKVLQNGLYDAFWLKQTQGIEMRNWQCDTLAKDVVRDPMSPHSLDFLGSLFTDEPYWKDRWKGGGLNDLYLYNGIDTCVTFEVNWKLDRLLEERNRMRFYKETFPPLWGPLLRLASHGVLADMEMVEKIREELREERDSLYESLQTLKVDIFGKKGGVSPKKLKEHLYGEMGLPTVMNRKTGKPTTDAKALMKLKGNHPDKTGEVVDLVLQYKKVLKKQELVDDENFDSDNRMRALYRPFTISGRMMSQENPMGTGRNSQNIDRTMRRMFIPDEGCLMVQVDLSQAEDRVVKMLTQSPRLIDIARKKPGEYDVHTRNASIIFQKPEEEITKAERYVSKRIRHGFNYGMGPAVMYETLIGDGFTIGGRMLSLAEIKTFYERVAEDTPEILDWQASIEQQVRQHKVLVNSWGRALYFDNLRVDTHTLKEAYSFIPQSEVADIMNRWGFIAADKWRMQQPWDVVWCNVHMHDGLIFSVKPEKAWDLCCFLKKSLERPRTYYGNEMTIWAEFKVGTDWSFDGGVEFKQLPEDSSKFEAVVEDQLKKVWWNDR